jgi:ElaB/YqjD/DUF883 family membrane-anchored ribosome-binding protein
MPQSTPTGPAGTPQDFAPSTSSVPDPAALKADAGAVLDEAKTVAGQVAAEAKDQVSQLADQAKAQVAEVTDKVKGVATEQKELLAAQIGGVADSMQRVAADLESNNGSSAGYARMIADNAEKLSDTIREKDIDQILAMAQDFGRKQPVAFMGAAALLGFAASRFLLASASRNQPDRSPSTTTAASADASSYAPSTTGSPGNGSGVTNGASFGSTYDAGRT